MDSYSLCINNCIYYNMPSEIMAEWQYGRRAVWEKATLHVKKSLGMRLVWFKGRHKPIAWSPARSWWTQPVGECRLRRQSITVPARCLSWAVIGFGSWWRPMGHMPGQMVGSWTSNWHSTFFLNEAPNRKGAASSNIFGSSASVLLRSLWSFSISLCQSALKHCCRSSKAAFATSTCSWLWGKCSLLGLLQYIQHWHYYIPVQS